ncbi:MAG TPA: hypothetical protein VKB67_03310 [Rhizomicrobium sp.]|nr:hypothetical protein [Rhizomicrobium sp.]
MSVLQLDDGAKAPSTVNFSSWFVLVLPALAAIAYPLFLLAISALLRLFQVSAPPGWAITALVALAILASAIGVMTVAFLWAQSLGRSGAGSAGRLLAHLAFTTPTLLVAVGNVVGLFHARGAAAYAWPLFWLAVMVVVSLAQETPQSAPLASNRRLAIGHGISALAILAVFILPHLANHLTGIVSGADHIEVMKLLRLDYRSAIVEPLLLTLIAFQIMSGFVLVRRKLSRPSDFFGTLQTLTGVYVGIYLLGHMTAAFAARGAGTDTNWNWLTSDDRGLLFYLSGFSLVGHYWVGPIAIVTHVACGLRGVMVEHGVNEHAAGRLTWALIALGFAVSSVILAGLLGAHIA